MPREQIAMQISIQYDRHLMSDAQHEKITAIMRRAAAEIIAKGALLSNPNVLVVEATEWDQAAGEDKPMEIQDHVFAER